MPFILTALFRKGWRQLAWLFGVIVTVFLLIYLVSFAFIFPEPSLEEWTGIDKDVPMGRLLQLICLFIDPGNIVEVPPYLRWFSLLVVVLGLILFCGLLISVISNMLERRVERYREGDIVYPLQNHIVIIGFDNMVPTLIQQICDDTHYGNCHILIQSTQPAQEIRSKIHTELDAKTKKNCGAACPARLYRGVGKTLYYQSARSIPYRRERRT